MQERYAALLKMMYYIADELRALGDSDALTYQSAAIAILRRRAAMPAASPEETPKSMRDLN